MLGEKKPSVEFSFNKLEVFGQKKSSNSTLLYKAKKNSKNILTKFQTLYQ